ncbi:MAG: TIGR04255 family protein [Deltaproteobacteria bacterium]|nr:TIGR04255 family protein [Deltaproteobacteria bacterium]
MSAIKLPDCPQVTFEEPPLQEVVCQLRFHQILKIVTMMPADFQDLIRKEFPVHVQEHGVQVAVAGGQPIMAATNEPTWQFRSADDKWLVSLASSFIALKTTAYSDFDGFLNQLLPVVQAFETTYQPPFYVRVGLRYVNRWVLPREEDRPISWSDLLNPYIAGWFSEPVLRDGIAETRHHLILQTERGQIGCRYSRDVGQADGTSAEQFTLDFDHYATGQIACKDIRGLLVDSNSIVFRLFCWCLTDQGYHSLKPRDKHRGEEDNEVQG